MQQLSRSQDNAGKNDTSKYPSCGEFTVIEGYIVKNYVCHADNNGDNNNNHVDNNGNGNGNGNGSSSNNNNSQEEDNKPFVYTSGPTASHLRVPTRLFFETQHLVDISGYHKSPGDLFTCSSKALFDVVPTLERRFYWEDNVFKKERKKAARDLSGAKAPLFALQVIPISFKHNRKKYLVYVPELDDAKLRPQLELKTISFISQDLNGRQNTFNQKQQKLASDRVNTIFKNVLMADTIEFCESDNKILENLEESLAAFRVECTFVFNRCYNLTISARNSRIMQRKSFSSFRGGSVVKRFQNTTINSYARSFTPFYYLLLHANKLSLFPYECKEYLEELLQPLMLDKPSDQQKLTCISKLCYNMLTDTDGLGSILETLVKMTVFDWKVREPGIPYFKPKLATLSNTRHSLDTLKFFLINATLAVAPTSNMHSPFDKNSPSGNMWNYVTSIYHEVFKEQSTIASYRVLLQRPDGVSVSDKLLNKNKIQWFYGNRKMQCDKLIWGLRNYFRLPTVEDLAVDLLHCDEISLTESRFNPKGSLLDLFPSEYLQSLLPSFARYEMLSEEQQAYVFESIDKITENLIWMVYLGCGYSYRFPELVDITYAGPNRALFIDNDTRCLVLFTTYTKGDKSTKPLTKRLDATTSKYLLYHIVILRQIQANLLGPEYCEVNPEHWPRFHGSSIELSQYILHQYVFFSIKESTLLRQKGFNDMLVKELGFNTRELRQAMVAIMRNYVKRSSVSEVYHTMTQELMFGHSVRTGLESYGLDSFSFDSVTASTATYFQAVASESWHNWIELESSFRTPQVNGIPSEQDIQELEGYVDTLKTALHNIRFSATAKKLRELPSIVPTTGLSGYLASQKAARRPGIATTLDQLQQVAHVLRSNAEM